jgi:hypothetical protein
MTVLFFELDGTGPIAYEEYHGINPIPKALAHDAPIDDVLHVVTVISNPCQFKRRFQLAREFISRMEATPHVVIYVVELAYGDAPHQITSEVSCSRLTHRRQNSLSCVNILLSPIALLLPELVNYHLA